ncbi:MAG: hypothetical protein HY890_00095 [Deltaproteobacteria bacterium]|nr:hypothetical protein [Deltaproteobacteria bacterium]
MKVKIRLLLAVFILQSLFMLVDKSSFAKAGDVQINCDGKTFNVPYVVIDPLGRKLGYNPILDQHYKEFPGGFGTVGINDIEGGDQRDVPDSYESFFTLMDGRYTIEVMGEGLTKFDLSIAISGIEGINSFVLKGATDKGVTSIFKFTYSSDPSTPVVLTRVATPQSLRQDITLSRKVGWIDNDGIMKSLLKKAEAAEESVNKGNTMAAENELKALVNEVEAQRGKHITEDAAKILIEDARYMIDNL